MGASHLSPTRLTRAVTIASGSLLLVGFLLASPAPSAVGVAVLAFLLHTRSAAAASLRASVPRIERRTRKTGMYEGELFRVGIDTRASRLAPGVQATFWDLVPAAIEVQDQPKLKGLGRLTYDARAVVKGNVTFRAVRVDLTDARGLWKTTRLQPVETRLRVLSGLQYVRSGRRLATRQSSESTVPSSLGKLLRELEFETVRPFTSGDRLRDMDWKRTAKYVDLMTKQWERQDDSALLFLVDASRTMRARHGGPSKLERALQWTLELAEASSQHGQPVGHVVFDEVGVVDEVYPVLDRSIAKRMAVRFTDLPHDIEATRRLDVSGPDEPEPESRERAFLKQLDTLRGNPGVQGAAGVQRAVARLLLKRAGRPLHIVVFTDLEGFPQASVQALAQASRQGHSAVVAVLPGTRFLAPPERPTVRDLENAYREQAARASCRRRLQANGIRLLELSPRDAALEVLRSRTSARRGRSWRG